MGAILPLDPFSRVSAQRPKPGQRAGQPRQGLGVPASGKPVECQAEVLMLECESIQMLRITSQRVVGCERYGQSQKPIRMALPNRKLLAARGQTLQSELTYGLQHPVTRFVILVGFPANEAVGYQSAEAIEDGEFLIRSGHRFGHH